MAAEDTTVREAILLQRKLEQDLRELVNEFSEKTGLVVRSIDLRHVTVMTGVARVVACTVETP